MARQKQRPLALRLAAGVAAGAALGFAYSLISRAAGST
jgi:hypothetical protein